LANSSLLTFSGPSPFCLTILDDFPQTSQYLVNTLLMKCLLGVQPCLDLIIPGVQPDLSVRIVLFCYLH
jgi:hypothetical protein